MSEPKRHHQVPQFCLERFAKDGNLELIDRNDLSRVIPTTVRNALLEKHFYSFETDEGRDMSVEKFFATHVEGPAAEAIRRLVDGRRPIIAPGIRNPISLFLAFQRVRGPGVREMLVEQHRASVRQLVSLATPAEVLRVARERGEEMTEEVAADTAEYARSGDYTIKIEREANLHLGTMLRPAVDLAAWFNARTWRLLEFIDPVLVTCDEPIALIGEDPRAPGDAGGMARAREVVFPIGARHALLMVRPDRASDEGRYPGTAKQAEIINLNVAFGAHRFIVRHPGTDPLRGVVLPNKAPSVFVLGDIVGMQQNASAESRAKFLAKVERGAVRFRRADDEDDPPA